jgi:hypothetical protein
VGSKEELRLALQREEAAAAQEAAVGVATSKVELELVLDSQLLRDDSGQVADGKEKGGGGGGDSSVASASGNDGGSINNDGDDDVNGDDEHDDSSPIFRISMKDGMAATARVERFDIFADPTATATAASGVTAGAKGGGGSGGSGGGGGMTKVAGVLGFMTTAQMILSTRVAEAGVATTGSRKKLKEAMMELREKVRAVILVG